MILIEYQGEQHFKPIGFGGDPEENFKKIKQNDRIKKDFCKANGYKLIEISFDELDSLDQKFYSSSVLIKFGASSGSR